MKFSVTGQEKGDILIQVTAWEGSTVQYIISIYIFMYIQYKQNKQRKYSGVLCLDVQNLMWLNFNR